VDGAEELLDRLLTRSLDLPSTLWIEANACQPIGKKDVITEILTG
jgi:hypothetical protein